jgi:integrase
VSYEIKERVVSVVHVEGCKKSRYCGPDCTRLTDGWLLDLILKVPHEPEPWRRREKIPSEWTGTKSKRNDWSSQRETFWLKWLLAGAEKKSTLTVSELVEKWLAQREGEGIDIDQDKQRFRDHVLPVIGSLKVVDVRPRHVHELVMALRRTPSARGGVLASCTTRGIYFLTKQLFSYAMLQELIPGNPILVGRGVLPKKADKDPGWRKTAVFNKDEVEALIYSEDVPQHRRVVYAISFLTGLRPGQVYELRWGDFEPDMKPLGRVSSSRSWDSKHKKVKSTKTGVDHLVPVHPVLAKVMAEWKLHGWRARHGAKPTGNDLIVPNIDGRNRDVRRTLMDFHEDLQRLGLRKRRAYDARRTFMSLALNGGASKDIVRAITHPRPADVFDLYVTPSWEALCDAVKCIRVELKEGKLVALPRPAVAVLGSILAGGSEVTNH